MLFLKYFIFSVVSVKKAIESLLENDLDMSDLYLSQGKHCLNINNILVEILIKKLFFKS